MSVSLKWQLAYGPVLFHLRYRHNYLNRKKCWDIYSLIAKRFDLTIQFFMQWQRYISVSFGLALWNSLPSTVSTAGILNQMLSQWMFFELSFSLCCMQVATGYPSLPCTSTDTLQQEGQEKTAVSRLEKDWFSLPRICLYFRFAEAVYGRLLYLYAHKLSPQASCALLQHMQCCLPWWASSFASYSLIVISGSNCGIFLRFVIQNQCYFILLTTHCFSILSTLFHLIPWIHFYQFWRHIQPFSKLLTNYTIYISPSLVSFS